MSFSDMRASRRSWRRPKSRSPCWASEMRHSGQRTAWIVVVPKEALARLDEEPRAYSLAVTPNRPVVNPRKPALLGSDSLLGLALLARSPVGKGLPLYA